jgi:hypothetical protein
VLAVCLLVLFALAGTAHAQTPSSALNWASPLPGQSAARRGVQDPAPVASELAAQLKAPTALTAAQVTTTDACGPASGGQARCTATQLVLRSGGEPVRPRVGAGPSFTQVFPSHGSPITPAPAGSARAAAAEPGTPAWFQQAYDLTYLSQTGGVGDTVAILDAGDDQSAESAEPVNTTAPAVTGAAQLGQTLTASPGTWSPAPISYSYQWQRSTPNGSTAITGAISPMYTLTDADAGSQVAVQVTASDSGGSATATSAPVGPVLSGLPVNMTAPVAAGPVIQGQVLTGGLGGWTGAVSYAYQWQRSPDASTWTNVAGATAATYTLTGADIADSIRVLVSASNSGGSTTAASEPVGPVLSAAPVDLTAPSLGSGPAVGIGVTARGGAWAPAGTDTYQWQHSTDHGAVWLSLPGQTSATYVPDSADTGALLRVLVTVTNPYGSVTLTTNAVGPVASAPGAPSAPSAPRLTRAPAVSSDAGHVADTLTVTAAVWSGATSATTQWERCTVTCTPDGPADRRAYTIVAADLGAVIRVRATARNGVGATVAWSSDNVGPVSSPAAGSATVSSNAGAVRSSQGFTLAFEQLTAAHHGAARTVTLRRARWVTGRLTAWVCSATPSRSGVLPCTPKVAVRAGAVIRVPASITGRLRVVVVHAGARLR